MAVPEAAMDENDGPVPGEDDVRPTGQRANVQPETKTVSMQGASNGSFDSCVTPPNSGHDLATFLLREDVGHSEPLCPPRSRPPASRSRYAVP